MNEIDKVRQILEVQSECLASLVDLIAEALHRLDELELLVNKNLEKYDVKNAKK